MSVVRQITRVRQSRQLNGTIGLGQWCCCGRLEVHKSKNNPVLDVKRCQELCRGTFNWITLPDLIGTTAARHAKGESPLVTSPPLSSTSCRLSRVVVSPLPRRRRRPPTPKRGPSSHRTHSRCFIIIDLVINFPISSGGRVAY